VVIYQNIGIAVAIKCIMLSLAMAGEVRLWMAVLSDVAGLLIVVLNGTRVLYLYPEPFGEAGGYTAEGYQRVDVVVETGGYGSMGQLGEVAYDAVPMLREKKPKKKAKKHVSSTNGKGKEEDNTNRNANRFLAIPEPVDAVNLALPRWFRCDECPLTFSRQGGLEIHKLSHSGGDPNLACGRTKAKPAAAYGDGLEPGRGVEADAQKRHRCGVCARGFARVGGLAIHMLSHHESEEEEDRGRSTTALPLCLSVAAPGVVAVLPKKEKKG